MNSPRFYRASSNAGQPIPQEKPPPINKAVRPRRLALKLPASSSTNTTMHFYLNGQAHECATNSSISELLEAMGWAGRRIAVEKNGEIVPRSQHSNTFILEHDRLEVVVAVGGG